MNEDGLCYTYNNVDLGTKGMVVEDKNFEVQTVKGCGKNKGLRIVVDSHVLAGKSKQRYKSKGFKVYITVPGVELTKYHLLWLRHMKENTTFCYMESILLIRLQNFKNGTEINRSIFIKNIHRNFLLIKPVAFTFCFRSVTTQMVKI
jgi:hypothetical protein